MKNVIIISSSPRINGNSDLLCQEFKRGAEESGNNVELINLANKDIKYCLGCYACVKSKRCFQKDDFNYVLEKIEKADVIVFATPVYFYSMSGQLKVFIDRLVSNYRSIHADIYLLITAWDPNIGNLTSTLEAIRGATRDCFENCVEKGYILAGGLNEKGEVKHSKYYNEAYLLGLNC